MVIMMIDNQYDVDENMIDDKYAGTNNNDNNQ